MTRWDDLWATPEPTPPPDGQPTLHVVHNVTQDGIHPYAAKALHDECAALAATPQGARNHALNVAAFRLGMHVGAGTIDRATVVDNLGAAARVAGLEQAEIDTVLRDTDDGAIQQGALQPRYPDDPTQIPQVTVLDLTPEETDEFWTARPELRHVHDFARARRVSPWAVLGVVLARIIAATPPAIYLPPIVGGKASLNLFVGLVGTSGSGKGAAEAVAAEAVQVGHLVSHNVGSGEGIAHGYKHRAKGGVLEWNDEQHAVLFSVPEIDSLAAQGDRKGATLMPQLRSGWTGEQLGFGYADPTKRILIEAHQYRMALVAGIQPARAGCLINDADGGTPQRFLWFPATDPHAPDTPPQEPVAITWTCPKFSHKFSLHGYYMDVCDLAKNTIIQARLDRLRGVGEALDGHALLAQLKTAAALALYNGRTNVTEDDWALADVIARKSAATRAAVVEALRAKAYEDSYAKGEFQAKIAVKVAEEVEAVAIKRVCRTITRALAKASDWMAWNQVRKAVAGRDRPIFETAIDKLVDAGDIEVDEGDQGTFIRLFRDDR